VSEPIRGTTTIAATPTAIWAVLHDPDALSRVLPGVDSLLADGPDRFRGVLAAKAGFFTVRADVTATLADPDPDRHVRLELAGKVRGIGGDFTASVPLDLTAIDDGRTRIDYSVDVRLTGQLESMGGSRVADGLAQQVGALVQNLEREAARTAS
jgi:2-furoyl-CoA dehydrogenase large subunit